MPFARSGGQLLFHLVSKLYDPASAPMTGGYAEYAMGFENGLIRLPSSLSLADGALIEPLAVALHGVGQCPIAPGSRVLVMGPRPIGLGAIYWARKMGATQIAVGEINRRREELAHSMGADHFIVPGESGRLLADLASEALGGAPDVVFECVGIPGMLKQAIDCVRPAGTIGVIGYCMTPNSFGIYPPWTSKVILSISRAATLENETLEGEFSACPSCLSEFSSQPALRLELSGPC